MALIGQTRVAEGKYTESLTMADRHGTQAQRGVEQAMAQQAEMTQRAEVARISREQNELRTDMAMEQVRFAEAHFEEQKVLVMLQGFRAMVQIYANFAWIATVCVGMICAVYVLQPVHRVERGHRLAYWTIAMFTIALLARVVFVSKIIVIHGTELAFQGTVGLEDVRRALHGVLDTRGTIWWLVAGFAGWNLMMIHTVYIEMHEGSDTTVLRTMPDKAHIYWGLLVFFAWLVPIVRMVRSYGEARKDFCIVPVGDDGRPTTYAKYGEREEITERDMMPQRGRRAGAEAQREAQRRYIRDAWRHAYTDCQKTELVVPKQAGGPLPLRLFEHDTQLPVVEVLGVEEGAHGADGCSSVVGWHLIGVIDVAVVDLPRPLLMEVHRRCLGREMVTLRFARPPEVAQGAQLEEWSGRVCGGAYVQYVAGAVMLRCDTDGDDRLNQWEFYDFFRVVMRAQEGHARAPKAPHNLSQERQRSDDAYLRLAGQLGFAPHEGMSQRHVARRLRKAPAEQLDRIAQLVGVPQSALWGRSPARPGGGAEGGGGAPYGRAAPDVGDPGRHGGGPLPLPILQLSKKRAAEPPAEPDQQLLGGEGLTARGVGAMGDRQQADDGAYPVPAPSVASHSQFGHSGDGDDGDDGWLASRRTSGALSSQAGGPPRRSPATSPVRSPGRTGHPRPTPPQEELHPMQSPGGTMMAASSVPRTERTDGFMV